MSRTNKINLIVLGVIAQLLVWHYTQPKELGPPEDIVKPHMVTRSEHHAMTLVASQPWLVDGEVLGTLLVYVYDDVKTDRPADRWELYDENGDLLAISWFDKFGIQRTAIDHGIVEQEGKLEGTFVVVIDGQSI